MSSLINAGFEVSLDNTTWYYITDDNRQPIKIAYEVIEKTSRMADGTLRRYVVARKHKITASWQDTWSSTANTSDGNKGGAWLKSFYEANAFVPIYVRLTVASVNTQSISTTSGFTPTEVVASPYVYTNTDTYVPSFSANQSGNMTYYGFITNFDYEVSKRNIKYDFVNINIEFTEI